MSSWIEAAAAAAMSICEWCLFVGESIAISAEFENYSSRTVIPYATLHQTQMFFANGKTRIRDTKFTVLTGEYCDHVVLPTCTIPSSHVWCVSSREWDCQWEQESHGNANKTPTWEWEWVRMNVDGNENNCDSRGEKFPHILKDD